MPPIVILPTEIIGLLKETSCIQPKSNNLFRIKINIPYIQEINIKIGEKIKDPLKMYLCDTNTVIANLLGIPAITIPVGLPNKQQIGIQILAPHFEQRKLIQLGHDIEKSVA